MGSVVYWVGEDSEVAAARAAGRSSGGDRIHWSVGPAGLPYRFGQRREVVD